MPYGDGRSSSDGEPPVKWLVRFVLLLALLVAGFLAVLNATGRG